MLKSEFNRNEILKGLIYKGFNIIRPWGVETADSQSFFSQETYGWRSKVLQKRFESGKSNDGVITHKNTYFVELKEGFLKIEDKMQIFELKNFILRLVSAKALIDSYLLDFVSRFRFKKEFFPFGIINNYKIPHLGRNIYYQYKVLKAKLLGSEFNVEISTPSQFAPTSFVYYMYLRDFQDEWVVHSRFLPLRAEKVIIKICRPWYNKAIPDAIANRILKNKAIKKYLLYRGERIHPNYPFNAYKIALLKKGETLSILNRILIK